jgi:putative oxidoreductase
VSKSFQSIVSVLGRLLLVAIFLMSALGNKIPNFAGVVGYMQQHGVPFPELALAGAIAFLLVGSVLVLLGWHARLGAQLLLVFLVLATYFFHDFWNLTDPQAKQEQMIQFLKNASIMGAMLLIIANGSGAGSLESSSPQPEQAA